MHSLSLFPALLQALDDRMIRGVDAHTLYERYGYDLAVANQLDGDDHRKGVAFALSVRLAVLGVDGTCDRQWHDLAETMVELQPCFYRDTELEQLHLMLLSFPTYAHHYRQKIPGKPERLPSGVYLWH